MRVKYWGTRGSAPSPSVEEFGFHTEIHGGNTSCVELILPTAEIIIDAGTGIRELGRNLLKRGYGAREDKSEREVYLLLSHTHWDHIQGFPFFKPAYVPGNKISFFAQEKDVAAMRRAVPTTKQALEYQQTPPYFPVPLGAMRAEMGFNDIKDGSEFEIGNVAVRAKALNHPDGYLGFRLEHNGKIFVYASDNEPDGKVFTDNLLALADGADLFVQDSQYTPEEYERKNGWVTQHTNMQLI